MLETRSPSTGVGTPIHSQPRSARCARANAMSPTRMAPKRKLAPTTSPRAPIRRRARRRETPPGQSAAIARRTAARRPRRAGAGKRVDAFGSSVMISGGTSPGRKKGRADGRETLPSPCVRRRGAREATPHDALDAQMIAVEEADGDARADAAAVAPGLHHPPATRSASSTKTLRGASSAPTVSPTPTSSAPSRGRKRVYRPTIHRSRTTRPARKSVARRAVEHHGRNRDHALGRDQRRPPDLARPRRASGSRRARRGPTASRSSAPMCPTVPQATAMSSHSVRT